MKLAIIKNGFVESIQDAQVDELSTLNQGHIVYLSYQNSKMITDTEILVYNSLGKNECMDENFEVKPDYSKEIVYDINTKEIVQVSKGQTLPANTTLEKFTYTDDIYVNGKWYPSLERQKQDEINKMNKKYFDKESLGVVFNGSYPTDNDTDIVNPVFQYDEISQARLLKYKDIAEVNYWRTLDNKNVYLTNAKKNALYTLLITEWAKDFDNRIKEIGAL